MSASTLDPQETMRGRDVSKVARGEQAPRPPQQSPPVSRPPPPSSTTEEVAETAAKTGKSDNDQMRRCYESYFEYHKCVQEHGAEAHQCKKVGDYYKAFCPEWTGNWSIN